MLKLWVPFWQHHSNQVKYLQFFIISGQMTLIFWNMAHCSVRCDQLPMTSKAWILKLNDMKQSKVSMLTCTFLFFFFNLLFTGNSVCFCKVSWIYFKTHIARNNNKMHLPKKNLGYHWIEEIFYQSNGHNEITDVFHPRVFSHKVGTIIHSLFKYYLAAAFPVYWHCYPLYNDLSGWIVCSLK